MLDKHLPEIQKFLGTDAPTIQETPFGYAVIKGNWVPSKGITKLIIAKDRNLKLNLEARVLHERVLIITKNIPIRSHEEESQEIVMNIGDTLINQIMPKGQRSICPRTVVYSVDGGDGFYHGFSINEEVVALLYVAKALYPAFVKGNSFIVPENTYNADHWGV